MLLHMVLNILLELNKKCRILDKHCHQLEFGTNFYMYSIYHIIILIIFIYKYSNQIIKIFVFFCKEVEYSNILIMLTLIFMYARNMINILKFVGYVFLQQLTQHRYIRCIINYKILIRKIRK